jgi:DNA-binding transcriptional LysR family regulator
MDWDKLRVFHAVAEAGSFTHAGESLNLSQSAVSRQISALEESLKVPLFHRHARGLILTEQGELLLMTAREVFHKLAMAEAMLSDSRERPQGPLRVTTTVAFGSIWLCNHLRAFHERYPEIALKLLLSDGELDLSMREADVAIRLSAPRQPDLVQRPLTTLHSRLYAAPRYLEAHGTPKTIADLCQHKLIIFGRSSHPPISQINWLLESVTAEGDLQFPPLEISNVYGIYRAVRDGGGIASLPDYITRREDQDGLVHILPDVVGPLVQAYFVYPEELRHSKRIAVFRDYLLETLRGQEL